MIQPVCMRCKEELREPGGLLISPPGATVMAGQLFSTVSKSHLCTDCYRQVCEFIFPMITVDPREKVW
jgi:hypothetical protein